MNVLNLYLDKNSRLTINNKESERIIKTNESDLMFKQDKSKQMIPKVIKIESITKVEYIAITGIKKQFVIPEKFKYSSFVEISVIQKIDGENKQSNVITIYMNDF